MKFAEQMGIQVFETSAKDNKNVEEVCDMNCMYLPLLCLVKNIRDVSHVSLGKETFIAGSCYIYMLWFNFILGSNFIFLCFKLIIIHYHTQKQRKIKFEPRIKLNHNSYTVQCV